MMSRASDAAMRRAKLLLARGAELVAAGHDPGDVVRALEQVTDRRKRPRRFDARQEELEELADDAIEAAGQPIDPAAIVRAIRESESQDEVMERLSKLFDGVPGSRYREVVEHAMFAADVMGYVHEAERAGMQDDTGEPRADERGARDG